MLVGFPPVSNSQALVLILGSMPSKRSLQLQQYYAHPQNSFWFIMENLFSKQTILDYEHKVSLIKQNNIALWDVLQSCERTGSLDSAIKNDSITANDFIAFFALHSDIHSIFFNGAKAEQEYQKRVLPFLPAQLSNIEYFRLPSTSPAMATMRKEQKLQQWSIVKEKAYRRSS